MKDVSESYGEEVILDLHNCSPDTFNRAQITAFMEQLCKELNMERCVLHFWDDVGVPEEERQTEPHLKGTTAIQFIMTSNITIHTLDILGRVYLNIFSCGKVDMIRCKKTAVQYFRGEVVHAKKVVRV